MGGGAQATLRSIERAVLFAFLAKYHHHLQFSLLAATGGNRAKSLVKVKMLNTLAEQDMNNTSSEQEQKGRLHTPCPKQ